MRIAFFHELPYGGARRAVLEFAKELKKNHEVDLFYIDDHKEKLIEKNFSKIHFFKFKPLFWNGNNWRVKLYKDTVELLKIYYLNQKIATEIDSSSYDFVFVHGSKFTQAPFILRFLKTSSVYYCQEGLRIVYEKMFKIPENLSIERKIYERFNRFNRKFIDRTNLFKADLVLVNSKFTKNNIKKSYGINATVSYMGVDTSRFYKVKVKKKYDLLFVGSMDDIDGYSLLNDALGYMKTKPSVRWLLREKEWISDDSKLRSLYSESRLLMCLAYREPFGLLPIESQACGTPVVAVNEGGYLDTVIEGKTGVFTKRDPEILGAILVSLLKDNRKLEDLSKKSVDYILNNWTWEKNTQVLLDTVKKKFVE